MTEYRHLIHGGKGVAAIYTRPTSGAATNYYVHADHLGSPELITNSAGAQVVRLSFGAYGERRGSNWSGTPSGSDWTAIGNSTRDGFTEALAAAGITAVLSGGAVVQIYSEGLYVSHDQS